jgi:hypothetical protein
MMGGDGVVRRRELFCWFEIAGERVGALHLIEFTPDVGIDNFEFLDTMDADYHADAVLAEVLCSGWEDLSLAVFCYGPILEFRLAWIAQRYARRVHWAAVAERLIETEFPRHSILVMKAFPLEYESQSPAGSPAHDGLIARQAAMVRYYRKLFGVQPFPGPVGKEGWLWRTAPRVVNVIDPPSAVKNSEDWGD